MLRTVPHSNPSMLPEFRRSAGPRSPLRAWILLPGMPATTLATAPDIAVAHAIIVAARPAMNSTVAQGELEIRLDFNSRIDRQRSRLSLQRPDGTEAAITAAPNAPPSVLSGRAELTHLPIAVLGVTAGWARWLEVEAPADEGRWAGWLWPACFVLIGLLLLGYREA
jgi:CopC domain-containing protein